MKNKLLITVGGELKKLNEKHTFIKLIISIVIISTVFLLIFGFANELLSQAGLPEGIPNVEFKTNQEAIDHFTNQIKMLKSEDSIKALPKTQRKSQIAMCERQLAKYNYLEKNNLSAETFDDFSTAGLSFRFNNVMPLMIQIVGTIVMLACIIFAVKGYAGELTSGTLKMQLIRPIKRSTVLTGKSLSVFAVGTVALVASTILITVVELLICGPNAKSILFVIGKNTVGSMSPFTNIFLCLLNQITTLFVVIQLGLFMCSLTRAKSGSGTMALSIIVYLLASDLESFIPYFSSVGLFSNLNWVAGLSISGMPFYGSNLWSSIAVTIAWTALFMTINYLVFRKRDMA